MKTLRPKKLIALWKETKKGAQRMNYLQRALFEESRTVTMNIAKEIPTLITKSLLLRTHQFITNSEIGEIEAIITEEHTKRIMEEDVVRRNDEEMLEAMNKKK